MRGKIYKLSQRTVTNKRHSRYGLYDEREKGQPAGRMTQSETPNGEDEMTVDQNEVLWSRCPVCDDKTRVKVDKTTVLLNFPLFCPKCKKEH